MRAQFDQAQARGVPALAARGTKIVSVIYVAEARGTEFRVLHESTLARCDCGHPEDKSYSSAARQTLYESILAMGEKSAGTRDIIGAWGSDFAARLGFFPAFGSTSVSVVCRP